MGPILANTVSKECESGAAIFNQKYFGNHGCEQVSAVKVDPNNAATI
jgi:hypothetical protein